MNKLLIYLVNEKPISNKPLKQQNDSYITCLTGNFNEQTKQMLIYYKKETIEMKWKDTLHIFSVAVFSEVQKTFTFKSQHEFF